MSKMLFWMLFAATTDAPELNVGNLVTNLGATGAIVIVVGYFLNHLREQHKVTEDLRETIKTVTEKFQEHSENQTKRFIHRQKELQEFFEDRLKELAKTQNEILKETVTAVKALESSISQMKNDIQLVLIKVKPKQIESSDEIKIQP